MLMKRVGLGQDWVPSGQAGQVIISILCRREDCTLDHTSRRSCGRISRGRWASGEELKGRVGRGTRRFPLGNPFSSCRGKRICGGWSDSRHSRFGAPGTGLPSSSALL